MPGTMYAASLLYPGTVRAPQNLNRNLRDFISLYTTVAPVIGGIPKERNTSRVSLSHGGYRTNAGIGPRTRIHVIDHHARTTPPEHKNL